MDKIERLILLDHYVYDEQTGESVYAGEDYTTCLLLAQERGDEEVVQFLLAEDNADLQAILRGPYDIVL